MIGYFLANILPCCGDCNNSRGDRYTVEEWKIMVTALLEFRNERRTIQEKV